MTAGPPDRNGVTSPTKLVATHACPEGWQVSVDRSVVVNRLATSC